MVNKKNPNSNQNNNDNNNNNSYFKKIKKIHIISFILFGLFLIANIIFFFGNNCYGCTMDLKEESLNVNADNITPIINNSIKNNIKSNDNTITNSNKSIQIIQSLDSQSWLELYESRNNNTEIIIIDIRTPQEYNLNGLDGAININFYESNFKTQLNNLHKEKTYLIYCRSGRRTLETLDIMEDLEFKKVYELKGGISSINK